MIDFLKILSKDTVLADRLYKSSLLKNYSVGQKFGNKSNQINGIVKQANHVKSYKEIYFCFFSKKEVFTKLEILIKPHYYMNNNIHNANDFNVVDCICTLNDIRDKFNLPVEDLTVLNIEFGLNFISSIDIQDLISCTIYHNKNEFINSSDNLRFSKISFKHNDSGKANRYKQIKFYAKGMQYPDYTDFNTARFEVKSKERKFINRLGISSYSDLLDGTKYIELAETLKSEFSQVLIIDINNNVKNLSEQQLIKLDVYRNTYTWAKLLQGSRNLFHRHKAKYFKLLDKSNNNIHQTLANLIDNKLNILLKTCADSTPSKVKETCAVSDVYIIGNCTPSKKRICPITGLDLKHESDDAKYIRTSTINYLRNTNKSAYVKLCSLFLPDRGKRPVYEISITSHLCKQIRNKFYNPNHVKRTGYNRKQYHNTNQLLLSL